MDRDNELPARGAGIRAVILDYGEVICRRPAPHKVARMAAALGLAPETFAGRYTGERRLYDRGDIGPEEYWGAVAGAGGELDRTLAAGLRGWDVEIWCDVDSRMTRWLEWLRGAGYRTAMLSNMHADMAAHARKTFEWMGRLDCAVLSCEVHLVKPEPAIYRRCLELLGAAPAEALFIDDRENNVRGAEEAGLMTVRFESADQLRSDLARIGFPVLPPAAS